MAANKTTAKEKINHACFLCEKSGLIKEKSQHGRKTKNPRIPIPIIGSSRV